VKWILLAAGGFAALVAVMAIVGALLPRGHTVSRAARFRRPPAALFATVRDFASSPAWRPELRRVEILPPHDGRPRHREITRHGPITYVVREELAAERLVLEIADPGLPFGGRWIFAFAAVPGGTELRLTEEGFVKNVFFRFLARFVFGHTATMERYLRDLAQTCGEPPPAFSTS
jgi:hypothetical protein